MDSSADISILLAGWNGGDPAALEQLLPLVEKELRRLARCRLRRFNNVDLLQTTALINETYLRLMDQKAVRWQNRAHFFGISARIMRRILLNHVRDRKRQKRGGGTIHVSLSAAATVVTPTKDRELIALDDALRKLELIDARKSKVVELRFFGGLTNEEIAEVLSVSTVTVGRDWNLAKAWLAREIRNEF